MSFPSGDDVCAAWFYPPEEPGAPVIVLGIGLGSTKDMGLDAYARAFQSAGYAALAFDYRSFGASGGEPRQVIDVASQLTDWRAAIRFARSRPGVDPDRVVVWGTSFGGGHAISLAAEQPSGVVAAVAQCPFTDGIASAAAMSPFSSIRVGWRALRDLVALRAGRPPVMIATSGPPHSAALMSAHDAASGFDALVPAEARPRFENVTAARIGLTILGYRPGRRTATIAMPLLAGICLADTVAPPRTALRQVRRAPHAEVVTYETGHFAIYLDPWFDRAVQDQIEFLRRVVPTSTT